MKVTYIYHSAFLAETAESYYLFDYEKGALPELDPEKPVLVLVSHSHQDHYNPAVLDLLSDRGMQRIGAVFPTDVKKTKYPSGWNLLEDAANGNPPGCTDMEKLNGHILRVCHSREYDLPFGARLKTLLSTDSGVAYLLSSPDGTFFHAGDLNDWVTDDMPEPERRQMTGSYRAALRALDGVSLDHACLPLDPHLGAHYADGFLYFLKKVRTKRAWPMHYWDRPDLIDLFLREYPEYTAVVQRPDNVPQDQP